MPGSVLKTSHVWPRLARITSTRSWWSRESTISSTCSVRSSGDWRIDSATWSANAAAFPKWWKKDPVVTPARAATAAVVAPARTLARGELVEHLDARLDQALAGGVVGARALGGG